MEIIHSYIHTNFEKMEVFKVRTWLGIPLYNTYQFNTDPNPAIGKKRNLQSSYVPPVSPCQQHRLHKASELATNSCSSRFLFPLL